MSDNTTLLYITELYANKNHIKTLLLIKQFLNNILLIIIFLKIHKRDILRLYCDAVKHYKCLNNFVRLVRKKNDTI